MPSSAYQEAGIDTAMPEAPCDSPGPAQSPSRSCSPVCARIAAVPVTLSHANIKVCDKKMLNVAV